MQGDGKTGGNGCVPMQGMPCPSGTCWSFNTEIGKCQLIPSANCATVTCNHDNMVVSFKSELYGVTDNDPNQPFGSGTCDPTWDGINNVWSVTTALGACGHSIGIATDDQGQE